MRAEEFIGRPDRELNLYRDVEITRGATGITADTACYRQVEDEVTAKGHINMWRFGDRYKGDALQLNLETGKGWVLNPTYHLAANNGQGQAAAHRLPRRRPGAGGRTAPTAPAKARIRTGT